MEAKKIRQIEVLYAQSPIAVVPLRKEYLDEQYRKWMFDKEVTKYNTHGLFPKSDADFLEFAESLNQPMKRIDWAIVTDRTNPKFTTPDWYGKYANHIGNASLYFNYNYRSVEFACMIGEIQWWGKGVMTQVMQWALHHCFDKLGMNRVWTGTAETNIGMNRVAQNCGMNKEGYFREAMFLNGEYVGVNEWGILKSEWDEIKKEGTAAEILNNEHDLY